MKLTQAMIDTHERYAAYRVGWGDGASLRVMTRSEFATNKRTHIATEYLRGYREGREARRLALARMCKRIGYAPTVLR